MCKKVRATSSHQQGPIAEFNIKDIPNGINGILKDNFELTDDQTKNFVGYIKAISTELKKIKEGEQKPETKKKVNSSTPTQSNNSTGTRAKATNSNSNSGTVKPKKK